MPVQDEVEVGAATGKSATVRGRTSIPYGSRRARATGRFGGYGSSATLPRRHTERGQHLAAAGVDVEDPFGPAGGLRGQGDVVPGQRVAHRPAGESGEVPAGQRFGGGLGQQPVDVSRR